jgi:hypothetical protein
VGEHDFTFLQFYNFEASLNHRAGLPDFSWPNIPNLENYNK